MTNELVQRIVASENPAIQLADAAGNGRVLRQVSQHMFLSLFSSSVPTRPVRWMREAAETAMTLLSEGKGTRYGRDWLVEIAFHGNLALAGSSDFYRNLVTLDEVLQRNGEEGRRSVEYVKGLLAYARNDLQEAEHAFRKLSDVQEGPLLAHHAGYPAFRSPSFYRELMHYVPDVPLNFSIPPSPGDRSTLVLCAADDVYFAAFAEEFAMQVHEASPGAHLHFHLINNRLDPSRLLRQDLIDSKRLSISAETAHVSSAGTYATVARYIIVPRLLREWQRVVVTDIDTHLFGDVGSMRITESVILDFAFPRNPASAYIPATGIQASHALFEATDCGLAFAALLSRYLHYMHVAGLALWTVDQVALTMVWHMLRDMMPIGAISEVQGYRYVSMPDRDMKKLAGARRARQLSQ